MSNILQWLERGANNAKVASSTLVVVCALGNLYRCSYLTSPQINNWIVHFITFFFFGSKIRTTCKPCSHDYENYTVTSISLFADLFGLAGLCGVSLESERTVVDSCFWSTGGCASFSIHFKLAMQITSAQKSALPLQTQIQACWTVQVYSPGQRLRKASQVIVGCYAIDH